MEPMYRRLTSPHSDLIIKTHPYAEIVWWGSTLKHFSPDDCISLERPVANGRLDTDTPLTLMAENGAGLFGSGAGGTPQRAGCVPCVPYHQRGTGRRITHPDQ